MKIAVEGCAHGELDKIYEALGALEKENKIKVDLLVICGDFQSVRNPSDLDCMAVPRKFRTMNTFYKYYSGEKIAPVLTIFVGGNHEASNYLSELPYGGWVCPNIYYMGYANVVNVGGIRIAGLSGIYKGRDYLRGHFECPPYDESSKKSVYHVRNLEVFRLKQLKRHIDICLSHDWPRGIYNYGNKQDVLRYKPFFKEEMENNTLGSQPAEELLEVLKPSYWFAAHLHCKFTAIVPHEKSNSETKFLALDKCLPRRNFLQIIEIDKSDQVQLEYDAEWLCILQNTNHLLSTSRRNVYMPGQGSGERWDFTPTDEEIEKMKQLFNDDLRIQENFTVTAPTYDPSKPFCIENPVKVHLNPQTQTLCKILNIIDPLVALSNSESESFSISDFSCTDTSFSSVVSLNPNEISISEEEANDTVDEDVVQSDIEVVESGEFFIDKIGTKHDKSSSDDFFVDKAGSSQKNVSDSEVFFIDTIGSEPELLHSDTIKDSSSSKNSCSEITETSPVITKSTSSFLTATHLCSTPLATSKAIESFPELKDESLSTQDVVEIEKPLPPTKKFRRRNYDLYKSECDVNV